MIGLGTIVNTLAIIAGGIAGTLVKKGLPERFKDIIIQAIGLAVIILGIAGTLQGIFLVTNQGKLDTQFLMLMIFSLVIGGILGEFIKIEDRLEKMGQWFQVKFSGTNETFAKGFVTASLIYCVGSMAIVGSLQDGLARDPRILFSKSILDGVSAVIFSSTMGIGVAFSAVPIFIYQGGLTLMAGFLKPFLAELVITQISLVGSVLIMSIGLNVLGITKIKIGNLLPAVLVPVFYFFILKIF